jgi:hypothetical protein
MRRLLPALTVLSASLLPAAAHGASPGRVFFEDSVSSGSSSSVTIVTHRPASFRVLLRVPTAGQARLFLLGKHAPKGGPLIRTSNTAPASRCEGAAGSFYCRASFEPLPKGAYTWRVTWKGTPPAPAHVELTVRW